MILARGCRLPFIYTLWLILNQLPQSKMLRPLGIKVLSLWIQTNSLLSLMDLDLGTSFGNLMYSSICMIMLGLLRSLWLRKCLATVVLVTVFNVIHMTLESINDSISCLSYIFDMATLTFQAIYEIVALAGAFGDGVVGCIVIEVCYFP